MGDMVLWIDFDALFLNCSTAIESIMDEAERIYAGSEYDRTSGGNAMDLIYARDYFSVTNSGVILYRNSEWTRQFVKKQMFIFEEADFFRFASIYSNVRKL